MKEVDSPQLSSVTMVASRMGRVDAAGAPSWRHSLLLSLILLLWCVSSEAKETEPPLCNTSFYSAAPNLEQEQFFDDFDDWKGKVKDWTQFVRAGKKMMNSLQAVVRGTAPHEYMSCNVQLEGYVVTIPSGEVSEFADCLMLPWLATFAGDEPTDGPNGELIVADLGAGDGECTFGLAAHGHQVYSFDLSLERVDVGPDGVGVWPTRRGELALSNLSLRGEWMRMHSSLNKWADNNVRLFGGIGPNRHVSVHLNGLAPPSMIKIDLDGGFSKEFSLDHILEDVANMPSTSIIQLENDGNAVAKLKRLRSVCALGFVPYALMPVFKEGPFNLEVMLRYRGNDEASSECMAPIMRQFHAECKKQDGKGCMMPKGDAPKDGYWNAVNSLSGIDSFHLAPLCSVCKVGKLSNADRLLMLCNRQFALIRAGSKPEARIVEGGFGRCDAKAEL